MEEIPEGIHIRTPTSKSLNFNIKDNTASPVSTDTSTSTCISKNKRLKKDCKENKLEEMHEDILVELKNINKNLENLSTHMESIAKAINIIAAVLQK